MSAEAKVGGYPHRIEEDGGVSQRIRGKWARLTNAQLLELPRDGEVWEWLRGNGVRRPSPSGPRAPETRSEADRGGCRVRLDEAATGDADALAGRWGVARPEAVARALREARKAVG